MYSNKGADDRHKATQCKCNVKELHKNKNKILASNPELHPCPVHMYETARLYIYPPVCNNIICLYKAFKNAEQLAATFFGIFICLFVTY